LFSFSNSFIQIYYPLLPDTEVQVSNAIESSSKHPKCQQLGSELRKRYDGVMEHSVYARGIASTIRGPFGIDRIELKDCAEPMHKLFFRCSGERETALRSMIEKLISRGWVIFSKSEWTSQAVIVTKTG
jgi:hypothetical protein